MDVEKIKIENKRRNEEINAPYNPMTGLGSDSIERVVVEIDGCPIPKMWLPVRFAKTKFVKELKSLGFYGYLKSLDVDISNQSLDDLWAYFVKKRIDYDFEFWAYYTINIKDKYSPRDIPFKLNRAQRRLLKKLEELRNARKPIKVILLKARQWGGSTLIQMYMLWIQLVHMKNWNSVICGDVETQSRNVRSMLTKAIKSYPDHIMGKLKFSPFEGSQKNKIIENTSCVVSIGSAQQPDSIRSADVAMAHLTEVGLWKETKGKKPEDLVQSIFGSIYDMPYSVEILESTAKGVGNYFNRLWISATEENAKSNFSPVFIPWFLIDKYSSPIEDYDVFIKSMDEYEWMLWNLGATLEAISWYRTKALDMSERWRLNSEFPSTPAEAFQSTGRRRFRIEDVAKLRTTCCDPEFVGDIHGSSETGPEALSDIRFSRDLKGPFSMWMKPDNSVKYLDRYVVCVDVGGISDTADWSDIVVFDRLPMIDGGVPEVVAEWHGHIDHDKLAWKAAIISRFYGDALLVIESNTLETEGTEGNNFEYILDEISQYYFNLYSRTPADKIKQGEPVVWGFHTNNSTKPMVIGHQEKAIRDGLYIERSYAACDEHDVFEIKSNGRQTGAVDGMHDDRVMARSIGVWVCYKWRLPIEVKKQKTRGLRIISEASM